MPEGLDYMCLIIFCLLESRLCPYLRLECVITALLNQNQIYSFNSVFHVDFFVPQPSNVGKNTDIFRYIWPAKLGAIHLFLESEQ